MMSRHAVPQPLPESAARRRPVSPAAARPTVRICVPTGTNAALVAELSACRCQSRESTTVGVGVRIRVFINHLLPMLNRRCKLAAVLLAVITALLLANVSAMPRSDNAIGGTPTAIAAPEFCGYLQFACDAIASAIGGLSGLIADGLQKTVGDAINPNNFCDRTEMRPERPDTGFSGFVLNAAQTRGEFFEHYNTQAGTTWAKYGSAGTNWNTYFLDCLSATNIVNYAADTVFGLSKVVSVIAILIFQQTFNDGLLNIFLGGNPPPVQEIIDSLDLQIYQNLAALAIVIGALILAYRSILKGFGLSDFLSKFLTMVAVAGLSVVFFNNAIPIIKWGNEQTNELTATVMTALRGNECKNVQGQTMDLGPVDCTAETIYNTLVFAPWANGVVGSISSTNGEGNTAEQKRALALRILDQQAFTWGEVTGVDFDIIGKRIDPEPGVRSLIFDSRVNEALLVKAQEKLADRDKMVQEDWGAEIRLEPEDDGNPATPLPEPERQDFDPDGVEPYSNVVTAKQSQSVWQMWSGGQAGERFAIAVMAVIGALTFGVMLITIAVAYLILQIATVLFALVAPLAFLVALVPVYGLRIFLRWAELFLGTFIKRIAMAIFVALLLTLYQVILDTDGVPWWLQMVLILAIAIGGASYRKKLTSLSTLGFGGAAGAGLGSSAAKAAAVRNTWRNGRDLPLTSRMINAGRAGAHADGSGSNGVRSNGVINQRSHPVDGRRAHSDLRRSGRGSAPAGYSRHTEAGPSRGSYPVPGQAGQDGRAGRDGRPGRGASNGNRELQQRVDQLEAEMQYAGVGRYGNSAGSASGRAAFPASARGASAVYDPNRSVRGSAAPVPPPPGRQPRTAGDQGMG